MIELLSLLSFLVSAFFLLFVALNEQIKDWNMLGWGLFFLAVGHVLRTVDHTDFGSFRGGHRGDRDIV